MNMKINLHSSVLQKIIWLFVPPSDLVSKSKQTKLPFPTVTGYWCPGYNPQSSTINPMVSSFIQQTLFTKCLLLTMDHATHREIPRGIQQARLLSSYIISAAYVLCELGQGPKPLCVQYLHLKTGFIILATSQGCHKDYRNYSI